MVLTLANDVWRCVRSEWCWDLTKTRVFQCFLSAERIGEALAEKTSSIVVTRCYVGRFASAGDRLHPNKLVTHGLGSSQEKQTSFESMLPVGVGPIIYSHSNLPPSLPLRREAQIVVRLSQLLSGARKMGGNGGAGLYCGTIVTVFGPASQDDL